MFFPKVHELLSFIFIVEYRRGSEESYTRPRTHHWVRSDRAVPVLVLLLVDWQRAQVLGWPSVGKPLLQLLL